MSGKRVLICDDNEAIHESMRCFFKEENIEVISAYTGEQAIDMIRDKQIDLVILDVMLPDISGIDVCREIKKENQLPILFLSAKGEAFDRILGLEIGGDDYVTKPFSPREVVVRVKKLMFRNADKPAAKIVKFCELSVDEERMEVFINQQKLDTTAREVSLLSYLIKNVYKVLSREQILEAVWGYEYFGDTRAVDAAIKRIRRKLAGQNIHFEIQTIYGGGYRLGEKADE